MAELATVLNLINYIFVLIFGIVVSFYFADILLWALSYCRLYAICFLVSTPCTKVILSLYIFL